MALTGIALDLDGVVADFHGPLLAALKATGKVRAEVAFTDAFSRWAAWECVGLTEAEWWAPATDWKFWSELPLLPWAKELVAVCLDSGLPMRFVSATSNEPAAAYGKVEWARSRFPNVPLTLCGKGSEKRRCLIPGELLIDDSDANVLAWREAGSKAILAPAPWNRLRHETRASVVGLVEQALARREAVGRSNELAMAGAP